MGSEQVQGGSLGGVNSKEGRRGRVLFADDEPQVLLPTTGVLRSEGFDVLPVTNGEEARAAMQVNQFDAMLLDIEMPGNYELQLLKDVVETNPFTPVVLLTGHPNVETAVGSVRLGVVDYLTKPSLPEVLIERLDSAVHRGRVLQSIERAQRLSEEVGGLLDELKQVIVQGPGGAPPPTPDDPLKNLSDAELQRLSSREREVLVELARGHATQQVAHELHLSVHTVRNHLKSIFLKLGVNSQVALLGKVVGVGLSGRN